jgi:hypothetical protein
MRKLCQFGAGLLAVLAFGALAASPASAIEFLLAEWLVNGPISAELETNTEAELLVEETVIGIKIAALCSEILDGTINQNGEDLVTELLDILGNPIDMTILVEPGLLCANVQNCPEPLVWADNMPWRTKLELMDVGTEIFFADLFFNAGFHLVCMGNGTSDLCEAAESVAKVTNEAAGLDEEFSEAFTELAGLKLANCTTAGAEKGILEGLGLVLVTLGGTLLASSE